MALEQSSSRKSFRNEDPSCGDNESLVAEPRAPQRMSGTGRIISQKCIPATVVVAIRGGWSTRSRAGQYLFALQGYRVIMQHLI
jgi:hypothetical protein